MGIIEGPCGYSTRLVGTQGKLVFRETLGESAPVVPRIGVFWHPAALRCQRQGPSTGVPLHGTAGTRVGGGGVVLTMDEQGCDPSVG